MNPFNDLLNKLDGITKTSKKSLNEDRLPMRSRAMGPIPDKTILVPGGKYQLKIHSEPESHGEYKTYELWDQRKKLKDLDWSSYDNITADDVKLWIELGMPDRIGPTPLNRKDLHTLATQRGINPADFYSDESVTEEMLQKKLARDFDSFYNKDEKSGTESDED